jgi:hypothetical protein
MYINYHTIKMKATAARQLDQQTIRARARLTSYDHVCAIDAMFVAA